MTGAMQRRAPIVAFAAAEIIAFFVWMDVGRSNWFYLDEWDFVAGRKAGDVGDLFRSHNGHWVTLPLLAFRALYGMFGLRTYTPYRVVVVVLYLGTACLLLAVMRRAGVHPWIATAAATLFALFGSGWENIVLPFQITFTGSFAFGLAYLLLADHDGAFAGRDRLGLAAGALALACSGVGIVMAAVVGSAVLARRGWQTALLHVVPLAACYATWLLAAGHDDNALGHFEIGAVARFAATGLRAAFAAIGPFGAFGVGLAILLGVGGSIAVVQRRDTAELARLAAPGALLGGAFALLAVTAVNRSSFGADWARQSRYISLVSAMSIPALAIAADALARRRRWLVPLATAMFLAGIPANLHAAHRAQRFLNARDTATRSTMLSLAFDPIAREVPRSVIPEPTTAGAVTIGWLLDAADGRRLPGSAYRAVPSPRLLASDDFRLSFARARQRAPHAACRTFREPVVMELHQGDALGVFSNAVYVEPVGSALVGIRPLFTPSATRAVTVLRDVGSVRVIPLAGNGAGRVCTG